MFVAKLVFGKAVSPLRDPVAKAHNLELVLAFDEKPQIQAIGATRSTMVTYLIPVIGVVLGVTFLGEQITIQLVGGSLLVVAGVWIVNR